MTAPETGFGGLTSRFDNFKPVIAAVNGAATEGRNATEVKGMVVVKGELEEEL